MTLCRLLLTRRRWLLPPPAAASTALRSLYRFPCAAHRPRVRRRAPAAMGTREPSAVSLEKFVLNSLSSIAQETSGRGQAQREVRDGAIKLLGEASQQLRGRSSVEH